MNSKDRLIEAITMTIIEWLDNRNKVTIKLL